MKILHVIQTLDPAAGGPATVAPRLAAAQAALGHDARVLCFARPDRDGAITQALQHVPNIDRVERIELPMPARWNSPMLFGLGSRMAHAIGDADFVHLHGIWEPVLLKASRLARRARVPYAVRPAGMLDPWSLAQKAMKKRIALALGYRAMLDHAAFIHTLNADEDQLIAPLGLRAPNAVIGNGVFFEELQPLPDPGSFYELHPELEGCPFVLFLGRLHEKKGLPILADAFAHLAKSDSRTHLVVAGPDGGAKQELVLRMDALGLTRRSHVVGPLYGRDKLAALRDAAAFCLPSRQEGFSLAITEALACGVPVVISEGCHFPQAADAGAGVVTSLNPHTIGDALAGILTDESRRAAMSAAGRNLIESHFTWPRIAAQVIAKIEEFLC